MRTRFSVSFAFVLLILTGSLSYSCGVSSVYTENADTYTPLSTIEEWQQHQESDHQVYQEGLVLRILKDDLSGSRHQRTIVELKNGSTLLISHNIDLSRRIPNLEKGDRLIFFGEYEWNPKGGVVHWTHKDPKGKHPDGFLIHEGRTYE